MHIITNWENDMIAEPEPQIVEFVKKHYPDYEFNFLSGFRQRDISDVLESIKESRVILILPFLLEKEQVVNLVKNISHPIHGAAYGAYRRFGIRDFVFLSADPYEDLCKIKEWCTDVKDGFDQGDALCKILTSCEIHFYGFEGEHYEMINNGYSSSYIKAIRHK